MPIEYLTKIDGIMPCVPAQAIGRIFRVLRLRKMGNYSRTMQTAILKLITILGIVAFCARAAEKKSVPLSVCELIEHRNGYANRIVAVRGEVMAGGHGAYLAASADCPYKLITRGVAWANFIYLSYPNNRSRIEQNHADFRVDWKSIQRAEDDVRRKGFKYDTDQLIQTYVGLFITYPDLEKRVSPGVPGALKLGFGPVGLEAPAQLPIKSVRDVVVVRATAK